MTKRTNNKENKHIAKVFWANQKFFEQKVCEMFKKDGVSKHSPEYKGRYLVVNVEQYQGKYYLSFGRMGWALCDYAKRIRKTMTMAQIDDLIAEYYDKEDEAHKKAVETYNNSVRIGGTKNTKKTTTKTTTTEPVAEVEEVAPVAETKTEKKSIYDFVDLKLNAFELLSLKYTLKNALLNVTSDYDIKKISGILNKINDLEKEYDHKDKNTEETTTTTEPVAEVEESAEDEELPVAESIDDFCDWSENYEDSLIDLDDVAPVTESYTELQDKNRPDYQNLYNEFLPKFHFSLGGGVGSFYFVLSNGEFCFGVRKSDKRCYFGTKNVELFATYNAEEMREYLTGYVIE